MCGWLTIQAFICSVKMLIVVCQTYGGTTFSTIRKIFRWLFVCMLRFRSSMFTADSNRARQILNMSVIFEHTQKHQYYHLDWHSLPCMTLWATQWISQNQFKQTRLNITFTFVNDRCASRKQHSHYNVWQNRKIREYFVIVPALTYLCGEKSD